MIKQFFKNHFEWVAFASALAVMAMMNPYVDNGPSWCLFELAGFTFCPGEGLGHSIAFLFRGDFAQAVQSNVVGPFTAVILLSRVLYLLYNNFKDNSNLKGFYG